MGVSEGVSWRWISLAKHSGTPPMALPLRERAIRHGNAVVAVTLMLTAAS